MEETHFLVEQWYRNINMRWNFNWSHLSQMPFKGSILTFPSPCNFSVLHTAACWGAAVHRAHLGCCSSQRHCVCWSRHPQCSPGAPKCRSEEAQWCTISQNEDVFVNREGKNCIINQMWIITNYSIIWQKGRKRTHSLRSWQGDYTARVLVRKDWAQLVLLCHSFSSSCNGLPFGKGLSSALCRYSMAKT